MKKEKIKNIILVMIVAVISGSLSSILTTNTISTNKLLGSVSHSDYLDSSNVTYSDSNVQDSIDNLYTQANDYSSINNRLSNIEGYFQNNPTSYFDGNLLGVGKNGEGNSAINLYGSGLNRGTIYTNENGMVLTARNQNEQPSQGTLALHGNPVKVNGEELIAVKYKDYSFKDVEITLKSASGAYFMQKPLNLTGISSSNKIISIIVQNFSFAYASFTPFNPIDTNDLNFISDISQTVGIINVRVVYI